MAGEVLKSTVFLRLSFGAKLNIYASISATSPMRKPLCVILYPDSLNNEFFNNS